MYFSKNCPSSVLKSWKEWARIVAFRSYKVRTKSPIPTYEDRRAKDLQSQTLGKYPCNLAACNSLNCKLPITDG